MPKRCSFPTIIAALFCLSCASSVAKAGVIFSNFGPGLAYDVNSGNAVGNAFDGNDYAQADTFLATFSGSLQSLRIALDCAFTCSAPVTVSLTTDAGDQPGAILESFSVAPASLGTFGNNNTPLLLNSLLKPQLFAGTQYWVSVRSSLSNTVAWNLNTTGDVSDQAISSDNGVTWFSPSGLTPGALEVDAVPEPASVALWMGGMSLLLVLRRAAGSAPVR